MKENAKWRYGALVPVPSNPYSDDDDQENEEDDELTTTLKVELEEKFVEELDKIKNEWLRNEVLKKKFEEKKKHYIINAIDLVWSVALVSGLGKITYDKLVKILIQKYKFWKILKLN